MGNGTCRRCGMIIAANQAICKNCGHLERLEEMRILLKDTFPSLISMRYHFNRACQLEGVEFLNKLIERYETLLKLNPVLPWEEYDFTTDEWNN